MTRTMPPVDDQITVLMSGVDYGDALLRQQMERELRLLIEQDRPLRVYLGIDPTATSLTLGHTVPLRKLRQFQQFGHHAIFLIGDYTALIGDPSDKNKLRPMLTTEDIQRNEATYFEQAARILDAQQTELRHNSEWLGQLSFPDIISLMSKFTVAEMLRRDNFRNRFDAGDAVYLHEFLYALMQGYDAYALECDVQVGGTEQLFNLMAGRKIQEDAGQKPHVPVTLPILVGLDGKERMSKSKGNHIGVGDSPGEQYGKAMSIPDEAVEDFFTLATNLHPDQVRELMDETRSGRRSPIDTKKHLAWTIVSEFWGEAAAAEAQDHFERTIQRKEVPDEVPEHSVADGALLLDVVVEAGAAPSRREARRLFEQRAVTMDGNVVEPTTPARKGTIVQVGKRRWIRLV
ncbi:tyrosine--tRNA ligase [Candidatus Amarobacter glycogenicus]|uniref:tyrosine--tRNA ligase n=1 Tax=Candidatus Amarobacter glycogenicus TaxID=3140699 RepID=UPI0031359559|nr:tyrosine--tRNA ligase [Dehalococcoidia bacterium]